MLLICAVTVLRSPGQATFANAFEVPMLAPFSRHNIITGISSLQQSRNGMHILLLRLGHLGPVSQR